MQQTIVQDFSNRGMGVSPSAGGASVVVRIENTTVMRAVGAALFLGSFFGGSVKATIVDSRFEDNAAGVYAFTGSEVIAERCVVAGNINEGFFANGGDLTIDDSIASHNGQGISSLNAPSHIRVSRTLIVKNDTGLLTTAGGSLESWGDNHVAANGTDGAFTASLALQ